MVRIKVLAVVPLYVMLFLAIAVVLTDVLLALSIVSTSSSFRFWPLEFYKSLVMPKTISASFPSDEIVPIEQRVRKTLPLNERVERPYLKPLEMSPFALSKEKAANATFVFHVCPGAGAGVLMELMQKLKQTYPSQIAHIEEMSRLSFPPIHQWTHWQRVRNLVINAINNSSKPCVIIVESPAFLTIRLPDTYFLSLLYDPLARLQNHYFLDHWGDDLKNYMHPNWITKPRPSFEYCVRAQGKDCSYAFARFFYSLWYCGFDLNPKCVHKGQSKQAAILSRKTIRDFFVVGVMEELHRFLVALELLVPSVFGGFESIYLSDEFREVRSGFTPKRNHTISQGIRKQIMFSLSEDYGVFNYTKATFLQNYERWTNVSLDRREH